MSVHIIRAASLTGTHWHPCRNSQWGSQALNGSGSWSALSSLQVVLELRSEVLSWRSPIPVLGLNKLLQLSPPPDQNFSSLIFSFSYSLSLFLFSWINNLKFYLFVKKTFQLQFCIYSENKGVQRIVKYLQQHLELEATMHFKDSCFPLTFLPTL